MAARLFPLYGLLVLGFFSFSAQAAADETAGCMTDLRRAMETESGNSQATVNATLPDSCTTIGSVKLGMSQTQVFSALGQPDKKRAVADRPEDLDVVYVYPRDLNAKMARNPIPADKINYSELGIRFHEGKVRNISIFSNVKAPPPFQLLGQAVGSNIGVILKEIGGSPEWNSAHDYVQYPSMPIGLSIDPETSGIIGVDIAEKKRELDAFNIQGLILIKDKRDGFFKGFK